MRTLLVTAYTPGYADLAMRLAESCARARPINEGGIGEQIDLRMARYSGAGSWERNGHVKPYAMERARRGGP